MNLLIPNDQVPIGLMVQMLFGINYESKQNYDNKINEDDLIFKIKNISKKRFNCYWDYFYNYFNYWDLCITC